MNACSSGFTARSFTANWTVNLWSIVSICEIGSRKSSLVTIPASLSFAMTGRHEMSCLCMVFSDSSRVVSGFTVITCFVMMPLTGMFRIGVFSPFMSPMVCLRLG